MLQQQRKKTKGMKNKFYVFFISVFTMFNIATGLHPDHYYLINK